MMTPVLLLALMLACVGPVPPVEPACPHSVDGWFGGAVGRLVLAGQGGAFASAAAEPWIESREGGWSHLGDGFVASTRYAEGYFLVREEACGGGELHANGDYDLAWGLRTVDALGQEEGARVEQSRRGCRVQGSAFAGADRVSTVSEIVDESTVRGLITSTASDFDVTATWRADHSAELIYDGHDGESWYEVEEPGDGTRQASFHLSYDGGTEDGGYERSFDGAREYRFDRFPDSGEWSVMHIWWLLFYDGSGQGEVVGQALDGSSLTCWYEWDADGVGSYSCDDGTSGPY